MGILNKFKKLFSKKPKDKIDKGKMIHKSDVNNILDRHFKYNEMIKKNYKKRNEDDKYYNKAITACEKQIEISDQVMKAFKKEYKDTIKRGYKFYEDEFTFEEYKNKELEEHPFIPPAHRGYKQLSIIKHKEGKYEEVINLCNKAKKQGWNGDWDKRIKRAENKLKK